MIKLSDENFEELLT